MARIFNIYFTYEDELRSAIVSMRSNPFFTEYILGNVDPDLCSLLPSHCTITGYSGQLFFQNPSVHNSPELMNSIIKSLRNHLQATEASF